MAAAGIKKQERHCHGGGQTDDFLQSADRDVQNACDAGARTHDDPRGRRGTLRRSLLGGVATVTVAGPGFARQVRRGPPLLGARSAGKGVPGR
jgi:hypothetical protein